MKLAEFLLIFGNSVPGISRHFSCIFCIVSFPSFKFFHYKLSKVYFVRIFYFISLFYLNGNGLGSFFKAVGYAVCSDFDLVGAFFSIPLNGDLAFLVDSYIFPCTLWVFRYLIAYKSMTYAAI